MLCAQGPIQPCTTPPALHTIKSHTALYTHRFPLHCASRCASRRAAALAPEAEKVAAAMSSCMQETAAGPRPGRLSPGQKNKITPEGVDSLTACGSGTIELRHRVHLSSRYWLLVREGAFSYRCYCCKRQLQLQFRRRFCFSHASLPPKRVGRPVCVVKVFTYNTLPYICF